MQNNDDKGLETLLVWQKSLQFAVIVCKTVVPGLPGEEKYALISQLRRSAESIPANIAEGYGRYYYLEGVHFAYIARGSLEETFSHLAYALKMEYISDNQFDTLHANILELRRLINGFINYLKKSKRGVTESGVLYSADLEPTQLD